MTNQVFYLALAALFGPVATFFFMSWYYMGDKNRALRRQWSEQTDAEQRRRHMDRVTFEQLQIQRENNSVGN